MPFEEDMLTVICDLCCEDVAHLEDCSCGYQCCEDCIVDDAIMGKICLSCYEFLDETCHAYVVTGKEDDAV